MVLVKMSHVNWLKSPENVCIPRIIFSSFFIGGGLC